MAKLQPTEKQIERSILDYLAMDQNIFAWKVNTTGIYDPRANKWRTLKGYAIPGISDIVGIQFPLGRMLAFEVKTPKRRNLATDEQKLFIEKIRLFGGISGVVTSIDDVIGLMNEDKKPWALRAVSFLQRKWLS